MSYIRLFLLCLTLPNDDFDQDISRYEDTLSTLKDMQGQAPSPQVDNEIARLEKEIELYSQEKLCYEAQILRVSWLSNLLGNLTSAIR